MLRIAASTLGRSVVVLLVLCPPLTGARSSLAASIEVRNEAATAAPCAPGDVDCDGIPDDVDNCPVTFNPDQIDSDGDGVGSACDNCASTRNHDQGDIDRDGEGDVCDYNDGLIYTTVPDPLYLWWQGELLFPTYNLYRGDLGVLQRSGFYTQDPSTIPFAARFCSLAQSSPFSDPVLPKPGEAVYYLVSGNNATESSLGIDSQGRERPNDNPCPHPACDRGFVPLFHTDNSQFTFPRTGLIDNEFDWCLFRGATYPCDTLGVDFSREVVLFAASGFGSNGCVDSRITCIRSGTTAGAIEVLETLIRPGLLCGCPDNVVYPLDIVKLPRPASPATFFQDFYTLNCPR